MIFILLIAALIAYGSLFPFSLEANPRASLTLLLRSFPPLTRRITVDMVLNVLLYAPLGLALFLKARRHFGRFGGAIVTVAASFLFSLSLEYAQFFQRTRFPNALDITTNTVGSALGVAAAGLWAKLSSRINVPSRAALILFPLWLTSLLFPLMPLVGPYAIRAKLARVAAFGLVTLIGAMLQWYVAGALLKHRHAWVGASLLLVPAQFLIGSRQPTLGLLVGAVVGSGLALSRLGPRIAAICAAVLLVLWGLAPFKTGDFHRFTWIPFADSLEDARTGAIVSTLSKCFCYGGTILLIVRARVRFPLATGFVALLLCLTEAAQMWIVGRTPASTDPVIAVLIAVILARFGARL